MPELPEVETVRKTLLPLLLNKKIASVQVMYDKMIINDTVDSFCRKLSGQTFQDILRRGKYLIFILTDFKLISHLRMEGKYIFKDQSIPLSKHEHVQFRFEDGSTLLYRDVRKFGTMEVLKMDQISVSGLASLGAEPFDEEFTWRYLKDKISSSNRLVKAALLDQTVVCGLGNIYVDEILFLSKIHPARLCSTLKNSEYKRLEQSSKQILEKALSLGGASVHSFSYGDGITGRFQNELNIHTHEGEPCKVCGTLIQKTKVVGRGTYFCPVCQRL